MDSSPERLALGRMAFGSSEQDLARLRKLGFAAYVDEQLHPDLSNDAEAQAALSASRLHIEYEAGKDDKGKELWKAVKEDRPLKSLAMSSSELWKMSGQVADAEKTRPIFEVRAGMWIRATHSQWQLHEVMTDFWHNHFNVNANGDDNRVALMFPVYDREVIRKHSLGNFRQMLQGVAESIPMLLYLNNASSKASPANENYARELFELHTLGAEAYFNHLYNRWRDVPGAVDGKPVGYIDQDVYEAARAFTGWTLADGTDSGRGDTLPNTGEFHYYAGWHDPYQKRVLGVEFDPNLPPMADGQRVLDLVAHHPATARHIATKLCRRLLSENPPESLIKEAADVFLAAVDQPDQIAKTLRVILLSPEFSKTSGQRIKKPFELAVSFLRATGAQVRFHGDGDEALLDLLDPMGQYLFGWPTPTGHPETMAHWTGAGAMLARWNMPLVITGDDFKPARMHLLRQTPAEAKSWREIALYWIDRMIGQSVSSDMQQSIIARLADGQDPNATPDLSDKAMIDRLNTLVSFISMLPEFQLC